jgi:predicted DNA-binding transcriptional regulator YafY
MSINKLALMRYRAIDECLRNRLRKWTLEDLIEKVSEVLYNREGIADGVSKRTIQADIQLMRSDKLGYNAPIVVLERKYYQYEDPAYTISKAPINPTDMEKLKEIVSVLQQMSGFSYFEEMSEMVARLENNLYASSNKSANYIQLEGNNQLKGIEHINPLYQAILHKKTLEITYRSFKASEASKSIYYPYLLKEYRNRWFVIVKAKGGKILLTLALDRIVTFREVAAEKFVAYDGIDLGRYYADAIGVTKSEKDRAQKVILRLDKRNAPYVLTKPLHPTQTVLEENEAGITIRIDVVLNFELEREILGFGEAIHVLGPRLLKSKIKHRLAAAAAQYDNNPTIASSG